MLHAWYARRLAKQLANGALPRHVGLVMDGNRRWARQMGFDDPSVGHRYGARHIDQVLQWCFGIGIRHVTLFVVSEDNLRKRAVDEVRLLMETIEEVVAERLMDPASPWRLHVAGRLDALPDSTRNALELAAERSRERTGVAHLTVAIGYDGRQEIVDAVRSLLDVEARQGVAITELAERLTDDDIAAHLYTRGQPDPDLIIRTSGELRMSGFLLWQAARSELHFCDVYWPGFRHVDFLRALRVFAARREARSRERSTDGVMGG
ncbi:polyprenyl diphosphate synthase [Phytoactinopolyspora limicola]|uniref:polyprenyl diphosphate synthase n=1 Tax=Phytoactinopolyspora limicola TaxID=2715536 RepID=UPI001FE6A8DB|nr:polyprenyl diphosphate synthase [Phytoactinopolyspora limicola]